MVQVQKQLKVTPEEHARLKAIGIQPGVSGNPGGFVKHGRIDKICREYLDEIDPSDPLKRQRKQALVAAVYEVATGKAEPSSINMQAVQWLADRGWGKVTEKVDVNNTGQPIFEFVHAVQQNRITNEIRPSADRRVAE